MDGIISAVAFGAFAGFIWNRLRARQVTEARKGSATLLVSFIQGGVLWALGAVPFLIGVVILGGSAIDPDFWWYTVLYTSVVFIGLPGWLLVLVAWRKTRGGKTGLKWGVAGGVMMAATGIVLLPGLLAVIGGVLSRVKAGTKPNVAGIGQQQ